MTWYSWIFWFPQYHLLMLALVIVALVFLFRINRNTKRILAYVVAIWSMYAKR